MTNFPRLSVRLLRIAVIRAYAINISTGRVFAAAHPQLVTKLICANAVGRGIVQAFVGFVAARVFFPFLIADHRPIPEVCRRGRRLVRGRCRWRCSWAGGYARFDPRRGTPGIREFCSRAIGTTAACFRTTIPTRHLIHLVLILTASISSEIFRHIIVGDTTTFLRPAERSSVFTHSPSRTFVARSLARGWLVPSLGTLRARRHKAIPPTQFVVVTSRTFGKAA